MGRERRGRGAHEIVINTARQKSRPSVGWGSCALSRMDTVRSAEIDVALSVIRIRTRGRLCDEEADVVIVLPDGTTPNSDAIEGVMVDRSAPVSMRTPPIGENDEGKMVSGLRYDTMSMGRRVSGEMYGVGTTGGGSGTSSM